MGGPIFTMYTFYIHMVSLRLCHPFCMLESARSLTSRDLNFVWDSKTARVNCSRLWQKASEISLIYGSTAVRQ